MKYFDLLENVVFAITGDEETGEDTQAVLAEKGMRCMQIFEGKKKEL